MLPVLIRGGNLAKQVKCPYCQEMLDKEEAVTHSKRYYHEECFNVWRLEAAHRKELIDYILEIYKLEAPTGMMLKQIKDFQTDFNYKLKGIELALRYFHETLGNPVQENTGIGIVPYVYEEAKRNFLMKMNVEKSLEEADQNIKTKSITIESPVFSFERKIKQIDISSLI